MELCSVCGHPSDDHGFHSWCEHKPCDCETIPFADELRKKLDNIEDILVKMQNWCNAYPIDIFPVPDLITAREVLMEAGISLDSISAYSMRHVVDGMRDYVEDALKQLR